MKTILLTLPSLLLAAALPATAQTDAPPPAPPADLAQPAEESAEPTGDLAETAEEPAQPTEEVTVVEEVKDETPGTVSLSVAEVAQNTATADPAAEGGGTVSIEGSGGAASGRIVLRSGGEDGAVNVIELGEKPGTIAKVSADSISFSPSQGPVTFMGVSVTPAGPELSVHLPLERGTGLVIQSVNKESPAEKAGLKESDILIKLDDQILIHPTQFSVLVTRKKEGDTVKLSLLRKGEHLEVPVTLGKNDQADLAAGPAQLRIGDVAIQVGGDSNGPVRTMVKRMFVKDGKTKEEIVVDGPEAKFDGKALERLRLFKAVQDDKVREEVKKAADEATRAQDEIARMKDDVSRQKAMADLEKQKAMAEKRAAEVAQDMAKYQSDVASQYKKMADGRASADASKEQLIRALRQALESLEKPEGK